MVDAVERRERSAHRAVILNVFGYALSFANSVWIARRFGATAATDAYFLTLAIPSALVSVLGAAMAGATQAVLARHGLSGRRRRFMIALGIAPSASLGLIAVIHVLLGGSGVLALMGSVNDSNTARLANAWFSPCSAAAMLGAASLVLAADLQASGRYAAASMLPMLGSGIQTIVLVMLWTKGPIILPGAYIAAQVGAVVVAVVFTLNPNRKENGEEFAPATRTLVKSLLHLAWPIMSAAIVGSLVTLLQRALAAKVPAGELSSFSFGWALGNVPMLLFGFLLGVPAVTETAMRAPSRERITAQARWLLILAFALLAPAGAWMAASATDVIGMLYGDRLGTHGSTAIAVVSILGVSVIAQTPLLVLAKVFAGSGDTRTPTLWGVIGIASGACTMAPLIHRYGTPGLAYAYVVEIVVSTTTIVHAGVRRWPGIGADAVSLSAMVTTILVGSFGGHRLALWAGGGNAAGARMLRMLIVMIGAVAPLALFAATTVSGRSIVSRLWRGRLPIAPPEEQDAVRLVEAEQGR